MRVSTAVLLDAAHKNGYAVPMYNTINLEITRGIVAAAEKLNIPILLGVAYDAIEHMGMETLFRGIEVIARKSSTPVAIHLDHGRSYEEVAEAVKLGFDSVMIDFSFMPFEENLAHTAETVKMAHAMNVPIEAEIGHVPGGENTPTTEDASHMVYTDPVTAAEFSEKTGVDFLAVSVGTVHGVYKQKPSLKIDLIGEIDAVVKKPLVLHGGSGTPDDQVRAAVAKGISKVNVGTYIMHSFIRGITSVAPDVRDVRLFLQAGREAIYETVAATADTFGTKPYKK
jgi:fructose-bisphosphate aldolase class II